MNLGKKIVQPPYLKEGDRVALVSPAYWVPQEVLQQAAEVLKSWDLQPVVGPHVNSLNVNAYAGTADERAADLRWAFEDESIKAVVCSRGGYGSIHLLNRLALELYHQHPKWLIGHGDITVLLYEAIDAGLMCIHGPMAFQIAGCQEPSVTLLRNMLFGNLPIYQTSANPYNRCGHAEGILVGGNLSSFAAVAGTRYQLTSKQDMILFLEEVEEPLHAIDRLFYMLRLQLNFERVRGIILGTFSSIKYDLQFGSVEQMLIAHLHDLDIPVCCGFPVGSNSCMPLIEGAHCSLDVKADKSTLTFNINGTAQLFEIAQPEPQLTKEII